MRSGLFDYASPSGDFAATSPLAWGGLTPKT
jgi:hypothetical protein